MGLDDDDARAFSGPQCQIGDFQRSLNTPVDTAVTHHKQCRRLEHHRSCIVCSHFIGYFCIAIGNIGYGKNANQTGVFAEMFAHFAVDGVGVSSCAHPAASEGANAYWTIDLGKRHQILSVTVYNSGSKFSPNVLES